MHLYDLPLLFALIGLAFYTVLAGADFGVVTTTSVSSIAPGPASSGAAGGTVDLPRLLPWLSMIWVFGVACCAVRLAGGWWQTRRLLRRDTSEPDACHEHEQACGPQCEARLEHNPLLLVPPAEPRPSRSSCPRRRPPRRAR